VNKKQLIDLAQTIETGMPAWHDVQGLFGLAKCIVSVWEDYHETGYLRTYGRIPELFRTCMVVMSDNQGTHLDGQCHFNPFGEHIDEVPLEHCYAGGVLLDFTHLNPIQCNPETRTFIENDSITIEELEKACAKARVTITRGDVVLIRTGSADIWPKLEYNDRIVPMTLEAVNWLIDRGVIIFGVDQASPDTSPYPLHFNMRTRYNMHIENLVNLDKIATGRFQYAGFPLKWEGGACSPIRPVAIINHEEGLKPRLFDLSHEIPRSISFGHVAKYSRSIVTSWNSILDTQFSETSLLMFNDHVSTHIEAPAHFSPGGVTIDQIPPHLVIGASAVLIDLSAGKPSAPIFPKELKEAAEKAGVDIQPGDVVMLYTGNCREWRKRGYHKKLREVTAESILWLLDRGVQVIGVDQDEIDTDQVDWPAHRLMRKHDFYLIENLALWPAVLELPPRFKVVAAPLKIREATASPVRVVALV